MSLTGVARAVQLFSEHAGPGRLTPPVWPGVRCGELADGLAFRAPPYPRVIMRTVSSGSVSLIRRRVARWAARARDAGPDHRVVRSSGWLRRDVVPSSLARSEDSSAVFAVLVAGLFAGLFVGVVASSAWANDTAIGGNGASFGPVHETRAAMRSEHIRIRLEGDDFHVHATYRLANLTDEPLELQIGFPESVCDPEWSDCMPGAREAFREMRTTVRGDAVPPVVEPTGEDSPWAGDYPFLWTFSVTFAPREEVEVIHQYRVVASVDSMGFRYLDYVVRTGANWGAPIGTAVFELELPADTCGVYVTKPGGPLAGRELMPTRDPATGRWNASWSYTDWVPDEDIGVQVMPWRACLLNLECPGVAIVDEAAP